MPPQKALAVPGLTPLKRLGPPYYWRESGYPAMNLFSIVLKIAAKMRSKARFLYYDDSKMETQSY